ncbi:hypothetical protein [Maribacter luteus]|uniref:ImmA/IrrE family metallo-endopeptidase n=1 Tax=Maribacter luteus TaxID=2594478 RepID=A0A6I2MMC4_9FLAO|nr:hypothetical protein [Maribacter luteus]MRX64142.1 hypothetical protein [Maribacter luteus]|tara:strand:- start:6204 stop:6716 length:513 start_codon:yes stop_codon:yes gene_type:complete
MKNRLFKLFLCLFGMVYGLNAQNSVNVDGRLQPILNEFLEQCNLYHIDYHSKLFQLQGIDIVNNLPLEEHNTVLGMVSRDNSGNIDNIYISWAALLDNEILKVVAFHEFAHHFLDYKHTCNDCNEIMAETNTSYFNIARNWDEQVQQLFMTSPVYMSLQKDGSISPTHSF